MKQYKRSIQTEAFMVDEEWMILHPEQYTVTKLNEIGGLCWRLLGEAQTVNSLAGELKQRYEITEEEAVQDIEKFLDTLLKIGLVEYAM